MTSRRELERLQRETTVAVEAAVSELDPEGLLAAGAPKSEYASEVAELARLVMHDAADEASIRSYWERQFGPGSHLSRSPELLTELTRRLSHTGQRRGN